MVKKVRLLLDAVREIVHIVEYPNLSRSYYPEEETKSKPQIYKDLFGWLLRHRDVNSFYFFYGLDRKKPVILPEHVLPYKVFRRIRDNRNQHLPQQPGYNYICLLRDKFVFAQFLTSLGFPTPRNRAVLNRDTVTWLDRQEQQPLETLLADPNLSLDVFCKKMTGMGGSDVYPLRISRGQLFLEGEPVSLEAFRQRLDSSYLLQECITQHPALAAFHPHSINAIRLVTFNRNGNVEAFWAALKIGTGGRRVDNVACGGVAVRIDLASGKLQGSAMYLPGRGGKIDRHPDSGLPFDGFEIPFFAQAVEKAKALHGYLYGIHSIGWDIAITETGPTFIEGNDDWAGHFAMAFVPEFKQKFLAMYP